MPREIPPCVRRRSALASVPDLSPPAAKTNDRQRPLAPAPPSDRLLPEQVDLVLDVLGHPVPASPVLAVVSSWSASRSDAMERAQGDAMAADARRHRFAPELLAACASQWPLASSCNFRSHLGVLGHPRPVDLTARRLHRVEERTVTAKPLLPWLGPPLSPLQRLDVLVTDQPRVLEVSADPVAPTGMTAPSWKLCAAALLRSSARRCTSLVKTMMR
jgi:hypothetical protein